LGVKVDKSRNRETLFIYFLSTNECPFFASFLVLTCLIRF
ncbi:unnamed protein product, partial [Brassica rapa subsp. trilocularis]